MPWDDGLIGPAREIAEIDGAPLRVQAGPGTGKTFALQRRVMRALEAGVSPAEILVVTFTRVAAADLREALRCLNVPGCDDVDARTLHSFCFGLLMREDVFARLDRVPRPLIGVNRRGWIQYEFDPLLEDIKHDDAYGDKRARTKRIRAFEAAWARLQRDDVTPAEDPVDRAFEDELVAWLIFHRAITIGELIPITLRHLDQNPLDPALNRYRYVIVDEYQDLNKVEQVLIDRLAERCQLTIVGDADQSIYSFKHANPDGIVDFSVRHENVIDRSLEECRRCPTNLVEAANRLITHNRRHTDILLRPRLENIAGSITQVQWASVADEVAGLVAYINHVLASKLENGDPVYQPKDILVLCPSRDIAYMLRDQLTETNVSAHSFYHEEALEELDARLAFCTLNLFVDREDRVALRYWLGFESPSWLANQYGILRSACEKEGVSPIFLLGEVIAGRRQLGGTSNLVARFRELRDRMNELYAVDTEGALNILFPEECAWARAFRDLIDAIRESHEQPTILNFFEEMRDYITQPDLPPDPDYVRIMSLYKSKGLTSRLVIIASAVDGCIPRYPREGNGEELRAKFEEQRRLFYVAVTRASEALVISHFRTIPMRLQFRAGAKVNWRKQTYPSPFIANLGRFVPRAIAGSEWLRGLGI